jgi:hypothetical protein
VKNVKGLQELQTLIGNTLKNIKPFSGETLILLSLFSWVMSLLITTPFVRDLLARIGWIFLTLGLGWVLSGVKYKFLGIVIYPGPWITGALTCAFIFHGWINDISIVITSWPLVSAAIATVPKILKHGFELFNPTYPDAAKLSTPRQEMVKLFLFCSILSCWLQFHFLLQAWLQDYPSLMADTFERSTFVYKLPTNTSDRSRGQVILNLLESALQDRLARRPWGEVERWLINVNQEIPSLTSSVMATIPHVKEDLQWRVEAQVLPGNPDYVLRMRTIWDGPSSRPGGYYLEKSCNVVQVLGSTVSGPIRTPGIANTPSTTVSQITCQPTEGPIWLQPLT